MEKKDSIKTIISIVVIVALAVFIVTINKLIPQKKLINNPTLPITGALVTEYGKCFSNYGESPTEIVFVHSNYCPYCRNMMPIVEELEKEGYKFYWAESSDNKAKDVVTNCFSDLLSGYVPQFICPKTGKEQTGEMGKDELKGFADNCNS